jgi:hypothetical protein
MREDLGYFHQVPGQTLHFLFKILSTKKKYFIMQPWLRRAAPEVPWAFGPRNASRLMSFASQLLNGFHRKSPFKSNSYGNWLEAFVWETLRQPTFPLKNSVRLLDSSRFFLSPRRSSSYWPLVALGRVAAVATEDSLSLVPPTELKARGTAFHSSFWDCLGWPQSSGDRASRISAFGWCCHQLS